MIDMNTHMKPFTDEDWYAYSGCESQNPYIWSNDWYEVVQDAERIQLMVGGRVSYVVETELGAAWGMAEAIVLMIKAEMPVWIIVKLMEMKQL